MSRAAAEAPGRGRVLVMDDEEMIRNLLEQSLRVLGYDPTTCDDGARAVELYALALAAGDPFRAVLVDLTVPGGMGGQEAAQRLLEIDPGARVVASSGYSGDPVLARCREYGFCGAISKPYRVSELGRALAEILAAPEVLPELPELERCPGKT